MSGEQRLQPSIQWDGKSWFVALPVEDGKVVEARWTPGITHVVRIRERGTEEWSFGFETPVTGCTFTGLKPDTEYELEVRSKNAHGESAPSCLTIRTDPEGGIANVIPFPKR